MSVRVSLERYLIFQLDEWPFPGMVDAQHVKDAELQCDPCVLVWVALGRHLQPGKGHGHHKTTCFSENTEIPSVVIVELMRAAIWNLELLQGREKLRRLQHSRQAR